MGHRTVHQIFTFTEMLKSSLECDCPVHTCSENEEKVFQMSAKRFFAKNAVGVWSAVKAEQELHSQTQHKKISTRAVCCSWLLLKSLRSSHGKQDVLFGNLWSAYLQMMWFY